MNLLLDNLKTAVLVAVAGNKQNITQTYAYLEELEALANTLDIQVVNKFIQHLQYPRPATFVGAGKVTEIQAFVQAHKINTVIFDDPLSSTQIRNLQEALGCTVLDRPLLILHIFVMRAKTKQAKIQAQLAYYEYSLTALPRRWTHLSRQGSGASMRGPGEQELETDRRKTQKIITSLKRRLQAIVQQNITQSKRREAKVRVALVGYTNAGKSSLMHILSKKDAYIEDKLFSTLSTSVRQVVLSGQAFLLSDTIGFILKLPHTLIESFKTTLAEVQHADILLRVIDYSHPNFEAHMQVIQDTLTQIGASTIPSIMVFNKIDKLDVADMKHLPSLEISLQGRYALPVVLVSAKDRIGIAQLKKVLAQAVSLAKTGG